MNFWLHDAIYLKSIYDGIHLKSYAIHHMYIANQSTVKLRRTLCDAVEGRQAILEEQYICLERPHFLLAEGAGVNVCTQILRESANEIIHLKNVGSNKNSGCKIHSVRGR